MILNEIRKELKANIDAEYAVSIQRFFKEKVKVHGVRTPIVKKISAKYFKRIAKNDKSRIFDLCECLLASGYGEEKSIAFNWAFRIKQYEAVDFKIFESWLTKYVSNWANCDTFCCGAFGEFIAQFPKFLKDVKAWTESDNRWLRRGAAVIMIVPNKREKYLDKAFAIAEKLLLDQDDMVQKGYGWMLKEISNKYPQKVFDFVMERKDAMPRTSLRYAIEKLSPELRKKAMAR